MVEESTAASQMLHNDATEMDPLMAKFQAGAQFARPAQHGDDREDFAA
jgi:hypothetical protein